MKSDRTPERPPADAHRNRPAAQLGLDGLTFFRRLIGGPPLGWTLEQAAVKGTDVDFSLVKGARRLEFTVAARLEPGRTARDCGVELRWRGDADWSDQERAVARAAAARLQETRCAALLARLRRDSLLYSDPRLGQAATRMERFYQVNDHSPDFWKFVYPEKRFLDGEVSSDRRYARVSHATLECRQNNPWMLVRPLRYFADSASPRRDGDSIYVDTSITEADVLGGKTQEILGRTLEKVAREEKPAFIHLSTTCLPELVGDNPAPFISRIESKLGVPVFWTSKTRPSGPAYARWLEQRLDELQSAPRRDPKAILLAGVADAAAREMGEQLCAALGLRVAGTVLPNLDFRRTPGLAAASAVVWLNPVGWETVSDAAFLRRGLKVVRHHPPFGLAGTRSWLERAAAVLGLRDRGRACAGLAARAQQLQELRHACRHRTVALVGDAADLELLIAPGGGFGFSVAGLLGELGFQVRCLVCAGPAAARRRAGAGTIEFVPFATPAQLDAELERGVDLVFTHFNHDPRLEAHGLLGFTESAFEMGLDGLLRSGLRLLDKCAARPFPRHRGFLNPWTA